MSVLLCLTTVSVFLHVNFVLKCLAMVITAITHVAIYFHYIGPQSAWGEDFRHWDGEKERQV
jgi:hypothetical protein